LLTRRLRTTKWLVSGVQIRCGNVIQFESQHGTFTCGCKRAADAQNRYCNYLLDVGTTHNPISPWHLYYQPNVRRVVYTVYGAWFSTYPRPSEIRNARRVIHSTIRNPQSTRRKHERKLQRKSRDFAERRCNPTIHNPNELKTVHSSSSSSADDGESGGWGLWFVIY
jgi:hypothetical protein